MPINTLNNWIKRIINKCINFMYFGNRFRNPLYKELKFLSEYIPKNAFILEAGAHTGADTVRMNYAFKGSTIYAFEPEPSAYKKLVQKTYGYKNIRTFNVALGNKDGEEDLFVSENLKDSSSSLLPQSELHKKFHPEIDLRNKIKVKIATIENWAKQNNIDKIDFMWLDMQGGELGALKAAGNLLNKTKAIYTEVLLTKTYANAPLYEEFKQWMENQGFVAKTEKDISEEQANVLFIKDNHAKHNI